MGERLNGIEEVAGSNPAGSTSVPGRVCSPSRGVSPAGARAAGRGTTTKGGGAAWRGRLLCKQGTAGFESPVLHQVREMSVRIRPGAAVRPLPVAQSAERRKTGGSGFESPDGPRAV